MLSPIPAGPAAATSVCETDLNALLAAVRGRLSESVHSDADDTELVSRFLSAAPVEVCLAMAAAWNHIRTSGEKCACFSTEDRHLLEMIAAVYSAPPSMPGTDAVFARLLEDGDLADAA